MQEQKAKKTRNRGKKPETHVRSFSTQQLLNTKFETVQFSERFAKSYPYVIWQGPWFYYGDSFNGKTSHVLQILGEVLEHCNVDFYSLEERKSESLKLAVLREGIAKKPYRVQWHYNATLEDIKTRLRRKGAAKAVFIDSVQYLRLKAGDYEAFKAEFPDVLDVWISHAQGTKPRGQRAVDIHYDAFIKVHVKGYQAHVGIRGYGATEPFDIWPEKVKKITAQRIIEK